MSVHGSWGAAYSTSSVPGDGLPSAPTSQGRTSESFHLSLLWEDAEQPAPGGRRPGKVQPWALPAGQPAPADMPSTLEAALACSGMLLFFLFSKKMVDQLKEWHEARQGEIFHPLSHSAEVHAARAEPREAARDSPRGAARGRRPGWLRGHNLGHCGPCPARGHVTTPAQRGREWPPPPFLLSGQSPGGSDQSHRLSWSSSGQCCWPQPPPEGTPSALGPGPPALGTEQATQMHGDPTAGKPSWGAPGPRPAALACAQRRGPRPGG